MPSSCNSFRMEEVMKHRAMLLSSLESNPAYERFCCSQVHVKGALQLSGLTFLLESLIAIYFYVSNVTLIASVSFAYLIARISLWAYLTLSMGLLMIALHREKPHMLHQFFIGQTLTMLVDCYGVGAVAVRHHHFVAYRTELIIVAVHCMLEVLLSAECLVAAWYCRRHFAEKRRRANPHGIRALAQMSMGHLRIEQIPPANLQQERQRTSLIGGGHNADFGQMQVEHELSDYYD